MTEDNKWDYINKLDEELLSGVVLLSEWTTLLAQDAEIAFCANANLASVLACQAAIESHLRFDHSSSGQAKCWGFYQLIEKSSLTDELKAELHKLRKFRNGWVHVEDPHDYFDLLQRPEYYQAELMEVAKNSIRTMLKTLYSQPWI